MGNFEFDLEGLTTPEHEVERWRAVAAQAMDGLKQDGPIPVEAAVRFDQARTLHHYVGAPTVEGSIRPSDEALNQELIDSYQAVAMMYGRGVKRRPV